MDNRLSTFFGGLLVGVVATFLVMQVTAAPTVGVTVPSHSTSAGTGCLTGDEPPAWVGQIHDRDHASVYLGNYSFTHDAPSVRVETNLTEVGTGDWRFTMTTVPEENGESAREDCQPRTTFNAAMALPADFRTLTIVHDGEQVARVENRNSATFRYIQGTNLETRDRLISSHSRRGGLSPRPAVTTEAPQRDTDCSTGECPQI
jgi:hypothetical protein